jgi:hypothetical protein
MRAAIESGSFGDFAADFAAGQAEGDMAACSGG